MRLTEQDYDHIYRDLLAEKPNVEYYLQKNRKKIDRRFRETRKAPVWYHEPLTMPKSGNRYLMYYYAERLAEIRDGSCYYGAPLMLEETAMLLRKMSLRIPDGRGLNCYGLQVYSKHFFDRYRQRMCISDAMSYEDVVATFFGRNGGYFMNLDYKEMVLERNRWKGNSAWAVEDGVLLSEILPVGNELMVFQHNTFLSRKNLKEGQRDEMPLTTEMRDLCLNHFNL